MKYENDNTKLASITDLLIKNKNKDLTALDISAKLLIGIDDVHRLLEKLIRMGVVIRSTLDGNRAWYNIR